MYLHLGQDTVIRTKNIVGIFDLDITTISKHTRDYLAKMEKKGNVFNVSSELPKSFIVYKEKNKTTVYISQLSPKTLFLRRADAYKRKG